MNIFSDMHHSQQHMTLYHADILLSSGGIIDRSVELLMMILLSASLESLSPLSYGGLTML